MTLLAIDTASQYLSLALHDGETLLADCAIQVGRGHNQALAPLIEQLMARTGLQMPQLQALAVAVGPGSYTGGPHWRGAGEGHGGCARAAAGRPERAGSAGRRSATAAGRAARPVGNAAGGQKPHHLCDLLMAGWRLAAKREKREPPHGRRRWRIARDRCRLLARLGRRAWRKSARRGMLCCPRRCACGGRASWPRLPGRNCAVKAQRHSRLGASRQFICKVPDRSGCVGATLQVARIPDYEAKRATRRGLPYHSLSLL